MTSIQKIIKYCAIAFAFSLIFSIVSGIMFGVLSITNVFGNDDHIMENLEELKITESVNVLDIEVVSSNITVQLGDTFKVETNNKNIKYKESNGKLTITEKKHNWFGNNASSDLVIYIPENLVLDDVTIESKAGKMEIESLSTKNLDLDLGAGKVTVHNLVVTNSTAIDGGAGKISILNGEVCNLELDMGAGELYFRSKVTGEAEIDAGVGKVTLDLIGTDYQVKVDKGIGTATINGENIKDDTYYGAGENIIKIDGGVGSIDISYEA